MGSSESKACGNESTTASSSKKGRSRGNNWLFQSSCLGTATATGGPSGSRRTHRHYRKDEENGRNLGETESDELKIECDREEKAGMACISNNDELDRWGEGGISSLNGTGTGSSSARSSSNPSRFLSRFSIIPGNISFRLNRATSLGSSRAYNVNNDDRIDAQHGTTSSIFMDNFQEIQNAARDDGVSHNRVDVDGNVHSPRVINELDNIGTRVSDRRIAAREPVERNVRFSRTLSVGRLRDRVLRRSSLSDITFCPLQQERQVREASQSSGRNAFGGDTSMPAPEGNGITSPTSSGYPPSSMSSSLFGIRDHEIETSQSREARYHDLLEHRSNFLERRRRIRSQVHALQRLGSRFENLSGHERSCILSGQHRTGRCTCRVSNRNANSSDETGTGASISRIVMLAEALFEVLDDIHQQSVVLSSRPSVSSVGSMPAPNEVVESLPVKFYTKSQKYQNEEVAQCYICLVEYEEGDSVRILPCHHEFHRTCVDKWLKEIHRVCPLCRGDICKPDSLPSEN